MNTSGMRPLGRAVLVEYFIPEQAKGLIAIPDSVRERANSVEQRARVVAVGPACWPDEPPRAKVGDYILISRMSGYSAKGPVDGRDYRFINDRDVFAALDDAAVAALEARHG